MKSRKLHLRTTRQMHRQLGLSMVELMVSMVVGLFLLAGVVTNFTSTSQSDKVRNALSEMDANARTGMNVLRQTVLHAGYPSIHNKRLDKAFYTSADGAITNPDCKESVKRDKTSLLLLDHATQDNDDTDVLTVISLADNPCQSGNNECTDVANANPEALVYYDCAGGGTQRDAHSVSCSADPVAGIQSPANPNDAKIYSSFVLSNSALACIGSRSTTQETLIENIKAVQYLYGVKSDSGNIVYRTATEVGNEWEAVVSVQIGLLMRSADKVLSKDSSVTKYYLLDREINIDDSEKRHVFNIYTSTVFLANKNRGGILNAN